MGKDTVVLRVNLSPTQYATLNKLADAQDTSIGAVVRSLINAVNTQPPSKDGLENRKCQQS